MKFSPDSQRLLLMNGNRVCLWDLAGSKEVLNYEQPNRHSYLSEEDVAFGACHNRLLVRHCRTVQLFDAESGEVVATLDHDEQPIEEAIFTPDGAEILTLSGASPPRLWDAGDGRLIGPLAHSGHRCEAEPKGAFSVDGRYIVALSDSGKVLVWRRDTRQLIGVIGSKRTEYDDVAFHPTTNAVVTKGQRRLELWDVEGHLMRRFESVDSNYGICEPRFSPDGRLLLATGYYDDDEKLFLWSFESGEAFGGIGGMSLGNEIATFSPNGKRLLTAFSAQIEFYGSEQEARATLWRSEDELERQAILADAGDVVSSAGFNPDSRFLVTGSENGSTGLWDARTGEAIVTLQGFESEVHDVGFSPDGRLVASLYEEGAVIWQVFPSTETLIAEVKEAAPRALTPQQRREHFLTVRPPEWCIEKEKWPYHTAEWKQWLAAKRAGANPELPLSPDTESVTIHAQIGVCDFLDL